MTSRRTRRQSCGASWPTAALASCEWVLGRCGLCCHQLVAAEHSLPVYTCCCFQCGIGDTMGWCALTFSHASGRPAVTWPVTMAASRLRTCGSSCCRAPGPRWAASGCHLRTLAWLLAWKATSLLLPLVLARRALLRLSLLAPHAGVPITSPQHASSLPASFLGRGKGRRCGSSPAHPHADVFPAAGAYSRTLCAQPLWHVCGGGRQRSGGPRD